MTEARIAVRLQPRAQRDRAVVRGERSRDKVVRVDGIDPAALREALGG